jgi:plastocyanin
VAIVSSIAAVVTLAVGGVSLAQAPEVVQIVGGITVTPNESLQIDFRFDPGTSTVARGETITWIENADYKEPHTVTVVAQAKLPDTVAEVEACYAPGGPCRRALARHGTRQDRKYVAEDDADGEWGLDEPGDSRWIDPGKSYTARISAPAGRTLYYLCATHPWMQGSIEVQAGGQ